MNEKETEKLSKSSEKRGKKLSSKASHNSPGILVFVSFCNPLLNAFANFKWLEQKYPASHRFTLKKGW